MSQGLFVTGTDTGVGKTLVACALLHAFAARGHSVIGMKPVAAGREYGRYADVDALIAASNVHAQMKLVNPYAFEPPIAPHIAADQMGVTMSLDVMHDAYRALSRQADVVIVEGAGGFMIPLNASETSADLACMLGLPVVLVVGMRLGCINHAMLTRRAIEDQGLACAGWVANTLDGNMLNLKENIIFLSECLEAPLIATIPRLEAPNSFECASYLSLDAMKGASGE